MTGKSVATINVPEVSLKFVDMLRHKNSNYRSRSEIVREAISCYLDYLDAYDKRLEKEMEYYENIGGK